MPFFDESPVTAGRIAARLWRAHRQDHRARRKRRVGDRPVTVDRAARAEVRTTVDARIRPIGTSRYRELGWVAGEPRRVRDDTGVRLHDGRFDRRRSLVYFSQHTDLHLCDAQAETRLVGAEGLAWLHPGAGAAHRPQETMATHVFDRMIAATNRLETSPDSGATMAWCAQTGDHTDNRTTAAARWFVDVLAGRRVEPGTGAPGRYEGVQRSGWRTVWHPDGPARDRLRRNGFPHLPGVLDAAVAPFDAEGIDTPWLALLGNHDQLYTGMFGPTTSRVRIDRIEQVLRDTGLAPVSTRALVGLLARTLGPGDPRARWVERRPGRGVLAVTPDPDARRPLTDTDWVDLLLADDGEAGPPGHGFTAQNRDEGTFWWSRPHGTRVQVIGLDTNNHTHGEEGRIGPRQRAWLEAELARHHTRYRNADDDWVTGGGDDRLIVVMSHHNSWVMEPGADDPVDPGDALDGAGLVALLARFPNVVLWFNGHSHQHRIAAHAVGDAGVFWEVSSASVAGWPQQGRTYELFDNRDGTLSVLTTVFDHAAPPGYDATGWTPTSLASLSRELAANDDRWFDQSIMEGTVEDRNVELPLPAPAWLADRTAAAAASPIS